MWSISWFRDEFGAAVTADADAADVSVEDLLNAEAAQVPVGSDGLLTVHDWAAPPQARSCKGALIGFDGRHTRAHVYRSMLEGIALRLKTHMDPMAVGRSAVHRVDRQRWRRQQRRHDADPRQCPWRSCGPGIGSRPRPPSASGQRRDVRRDLVHHRWTQPRRSSNATTPSSRCPNTRRSMPFWRRSRRASTSTSIR